MPTRRYAQHIIPDRPQPKPTEEDEPPLPSPLEGRLSDTSTLIASINLLLDESPTGIAAGRPAPLTAEPGPQIDYGLVSRVLLVTEKMLSPEDIRSLQAVDHLRRKYFNAHRAFAQIHRGIQDLWAQRQLLADKAEQIRYNMPNNNNNNGLGYYHDYNRRTALWRNAVEQSLNLRQAHEALERYYRCAKAVATVTQEFFDAKVKAMPAIYLAQSKLLDVWAAARQEEAARSDSAASTPTATTAITIPTRKRSRNETDGEEGGENSSPKRLREGS